MDRVIEKKRWTSKKILTIAGIVALVGLQMNIVSLDTGNLEMIFGRFVFKIYHVLSLREKGHTLPLTNC